MSPRHLPLLLAARAPLETRVVPSVVPDEHARPEPLLKFIGVDGPPQRVVGNGGTASADSLTKPSSTLVIGH